MPYFALFYDYVEDVVARRPPLRPAHLALVQNAHARGEVVMGGALGDPPDGALIVFKTDAQDAVEAFVRQDPYVHGQLVARWRIVPWTVVVGGA
jgi:uncharacterized protein YciI